MKNRIAFLTVVMGILGSPALADGLPITGVWGNKEGCIFHKTGDIYSDSKLVLKGDTFEPYEAICELVDVRSASNGRHLVTAICDGEGEQYPVEFMVIENDPEKTLTYSATDGSRTETLTRCDQ